MSNDSPESATDDFLDDMMHEMTLNLSPCGGRVFVRPAAKGNLNSPSIELKCWWYGPDLWSIFQHSITIGEEKHKLPPVDEDDDIPERDWEEQVGWRLGQCPIMLTFDEVDDAWLANSAERNGGEALKGQLSYYPPVDADEFGKDARPTVTAWVPLGQDNLRLLRDRVLAGDHFDLSIGLTVRFPKGSVRREALGKCVKWDGKEALQIKDAVIVWKRHDWSADTDDKTELLQEPKPYEAPREHVEILAATNRIELRVAKLVTPLWLAIAALLWIALTHR